MLIGVKKALHKKTSQHVLCICCTYRTLVSMYYCIICIYIYSKHELVRYWYLQPESSLRVSSLSVKAPGWWAALPIPGTHFFCATSIRSHRLKWHGGKVGGKNRSISNHQLHSTSVFTLCSRKQLSSNECVSAVASTCGTSRHGPSEKKTRPAKCHKRQDQE